MRFIKFLFKSAIILIVLGAGIYFIGTHFLSEKAADIIATEIENNGQLDEVRQYVNQTPELKQMLESSANVDPGALPFTSKEEAIQTVIKKVGISELYSIQSLYENGMTQAEQVQLIQELESKLTADEVAALKYVIYQELYR